MRDDRQNIFEKQFVDNQWSQMAELLDDSMPVPSPAVSPWMVRLLTTLTILSIALAVFFAYKYKTIIPTTNMVKEHTVYKTVYVNAANEILSTEVKEATTSQKNTKHKTGTVVETTSIVETRPVIVNSSTTLPTHISENGLIANLTSLQNKVFEITKSNEELSLFEEAPLTIAKEKRPIQYNVGIEAVASTDLEYTGLGFQSGLVIPLSNKLGLNTGVAFNYITREDYFLPSLDRNTDNSSFGQSIQNLKQVYIPLGIHYAFTENLALNSGVRVRYTYDEDVSNQFGNRGISLKPSIATDESILDNTNVGLTAGFLYRVNGSFSVLLNSEWRLHSIFGSSGIPNVSQPSYRRNMVNMTTSYTF